MNLIKTILILSGIAAAGLTAQAEDGGATAKPAWATNFNAMIEDGSTHQDAIHQEMNRRFDPAAPANIDAMADEDTGKRALASQGDSE